MPTNDYKPIRVISVFALTAVLILFLHACSKSPQAYIESGKKYLEEGRYNEALIEFRNAARNDARYPEASYQTARLYMRMGAYPEALRELEATVGNDHNRIDAHFGMGNILMMQRKFNEAREKAELILRRDPENIEAQILRANSWAGMIHVNDSIHDIRIGLGREPRLTPPFFMLGTGDGVSQLDAGKAEELYRDIVDSNGQPVKARLALGNFYLMMGRNSEAEEQYKAAAQDNPQSLDVISALGFFYMRNRRSAEAEEQYEKYVELSKDADPDSRVILPDFYLASGEIDRGIQALEKMVEDNPKSIVFKRRLASVYFDQRAFDKAEELADVLIKNDAEDATAHSIKGRISLSRDRGADAASHFQIVTRRRPRSTQAHYFLGRAYQLNGEPSKAEEELGFAVTLDPSNYRALLTLASLKLEAGNAYEAADLAQKALSQNPNLDEARLILGAALTAKKDYRAAATELQAFIVKNPDNPAGMIQLGRLNMAQGNTAAAESRFEAALKIDPDNLPAMTELVKLYEVQKKPGMAATRINAQIQKSSHAAGFYGLLGKVYEGQGDTGKAEEAYLKQASMDENHAAP